MRTPKIFISYSRSSNEHCNWVRDLAQRLILDGIDVVLDVWDLMEGQDMYAFMESMVTDQEIHRVLIISDAEYAAKANDRRGGVGDETQIITNDRIGE